MECRLASDLMMKYLDGDIGNDELKTLMNHMDSCNNCREEFSLLKETFDIVENTLDLDIPDSMEKDIMNSIDINKYKKKSLKLVPIIFLEVILISIINTFIILKLIRTIGFKEILVKVTIGFINFTSYTIPNMIILFNKALGKVYDIFSSFGLLVITIIFIVIAINILFIKFIKINIKEV